ncbi:MAG: hypothetical protein PHV74_12040 [Dehalococcoidia bacterium]|nr:hypothetical protein [Dehalococcoidia bacterium]
MSEHATEEDMGKFDLTLIRETEIDAKKSDEEAAKWRVIKCSKNLC